VACFLELLKHKDCMVEGSLGHSWQLYHSHAFFYFLSAQLQKKIHIQMSKINITAYQLFLI
jgi:hypothetical protein